MIRRRYDQGYQDHIFYREGKKTQRNRKRLELLRRFVPGGTLLEIGFGTGSFLRQAEGYFQVEGMDVSQYAVEQVRSHFGERVRAGNVEDTSLEHEKYDVIAVFNVFEHISQPREAAGRLWSALKSGGWLIGSVPNKQGMIGRPLTAITNFFDRTHISTLAPSAWESIFYRAGFQELHFLGEINFTRNLCFYLFRPVWKIVAFNLIFVCKK